MVLLQLVMQSKPLTRSCTLPDHHKIKLVPLTASALCRVRQQYSSNRDQDVGQMVVGILLSIMSCILEGFLQLVEFLTKFAVRPGLEGLVWPFFFFFFFFSNQKFRSNY